MWLTRNNFHVNIYIFVIYVFMWEGNFLAANSALLNKRHLYMVCEFFFCCWCVLHSHYLGGFKVKP